jgi:uncharacterized protein (UPF0335 family)
MGRRRTADRSAGVIWIEDPGKPSARRCDPRLGRDPPSLSFVIDPSRPRRYPRPPCKSGDDDSMAKPVSEEEIKAGGVAVDRLRSLVERIERLEEERKALSSDIKDIYAEAKSAGFDVKVLRQLIRIRKQEAAEVEEQETMLDIYRRALGM